MCYCELYEEYLREVEILADYVRYLRAVSKNAPLNQKEGIKRRISILYTMYREMKETTEYLGRRCEVNSNEKKIIIFR